MRPQDRQSQLTDIVRQQGRISVDQLTKTFNVSAETVRRDINRLCHKGILEKVHGGAILPRSAGEGPFQQRMNLNIEAKRSIARKAKQLVSPGETLFIDTGSTTLMFVDELSDIDNLTVITNSTAIAKTVKSANQTTDVYLLGGLYQDDNQQTSGLLATNQINQFYTDKAILAIGAIEANSGVMDFDFDEAQVASAMMKRTRQVIVLADSSKFNQTAVFSVCGFDAIDTIVCDQAPEASLNDALQNAGIRLIH